MQSPSCVPPIAGRKRSHMFRFSKGAMSESSSRRMLFRRFACALLPLAAVVAYAQVDPGIRNGAPGAGQPFATGLSAGQLAFFNSNGIPEFTEVEAVADGLGPRFNLDSCAGCHAFPADRRIQPADEQSSSRARLDYGARQHSPCVPQHQWADSRGALHPQSRRDARWRRTRHLYDSWANG